MSAKISLFFLILAMASPLHAQSLDRSTEHLAARVLPVTVTVTVKTSDGTILGNGSGFVVAKNRIVTNLHVVAEAGKTPGALVTVRFANGQSKAVAGVTDVDVLSDIALLVVDTGSAHPLPFGGTAKIGQAVMAVGSPRGLGGSVSTGIVSARRTYRGIEILQVTAPISPGSSGGVLVDGAGNVIGITSFYYKDSQNINFAYAASRITQMLKKKTGTQMSWASLGRQIGEALANASEKTGATSTLSFNEAYTRGCKCLEQKRYEEAEKYLRLAVRLKASSPEAHANLSECLYQLDKNDEAIEEATEAVKIRGNSESYSDLGDVCKDTGHLEEAIVAYKKSFYLLSQESDIGTFIHTYHEYQIRWRLAISYDAAKHVDNALEQYRACYVGLDKVRVSAAEPEKSESKEEAAIKAYVAESIGHFLQDFSDLLVAQFMSSNDKILKEEVLDVCTKAMACRPENGAMRLLYGYALYINGKKPQGIAEWKIVSKSSDKDLRDKALGYLAENSEEPKEAQEKLKNP